MATNDIELILSRQLAECLSIPVFIIDTEGALLFYNELAEELLGKRYEETGPMTVDEWGTMFKPYDESGNPVKPEDLPLVRSLNDCLPAHGSLWIESLKGEKHKISVNSFPLIGRGNRLLGAMAIFWKIH